MREKGRKNARNENEIETDSNGYYIVNDVDATKSSS